MTSQVQIVNRGLSKLGEARITSIDDNLKQARAMKACYDTLLRAELRRNRWNFAMERAELSALSSTPTFGYDYQYQLPSDCLRICEVIDGIRVYNLDDYRGQQELPFRIEGRKILTDLAAPLQIRYIKEVTNPNDFDALFVETFACRLAFENAEELTQSTSKKEAAWNEYRASLSDAVKVNAIEIPPEGQYDDAWVWGRL